MITISDIAQRVQPFRGAYAESFRKTLVDGRQPNWSGSDIKGNAAKYGSHYHRQRAKVIDALKREGRKLGVMVERLSLTRYEHGRIVVDVVEGPQREGM